MKVLIICRYKSGTEAHVAPFIKEQVDALKSYGTVCEYYLVVRSGAKGYLHDLPKLKKVIREFSPDVIHAHYGLCGLLANLQRQVPVVTTYHGSDINQKAILPFSRIAMLLSAHNIFVSKKTLSIARQRRKYTLLPCGINLSDLQLTDKNEARMRMGLDLNKKFVLFASAFDIAVKNYPLAKAAMALVPEAELIELKGYSRNQVTLLMCAADCFLMTSHTEGSPQVIKEAMACGCPIVSVDVGDVKEMITGLDGCFLTTIVPQSIAENVNIAISSCIRTQGRDRIIKYELENQIVVEKLLVIYSSVMRRRNRKHRIIGNILEI